MYALFQAKNDFEHQNLREGNEQLKAEIGALTADGTQGDGAGDTQNLLDNNAESPAERRELIPKVLPRPNTTEPACDSFMRTSKDEPPEGGSLVAMMTWRERRGSELADTTITAVSVTVPSEAEPDAAKPQARNPIRRRWSADEEGRFLRALKLFEKETLVNHFEGRISVQLGPRVAEMISIMVKTRSKEQVRSHVQKHFIRMWREAARANC